MPPLATTARPLRPQYRLYVDEVGNDDMRPREDIHHRYLSLTGIAISLEDVRSVLAPALQEMRGLFQSDPDEDVVFHRKELSRRLHPFGALMDPDTNDEFNSMLTSLLNRLDYTVFTVTIDKFEHHNRYKVWRFHPYHYCMHVLVERYVQWLERAGSAGDVMSEARTPKTDKKLKSTFTTCYRDGTEYVKADRIQQRITSSQIKLKRKSANIDGLQLADMVAYPSYRHMRARRLGENPTGDFWEQIAAILVSRKYHRRYDGEINGWGTKWLPA